MRYDKGDGGQQEQENKAIDTVIALFTKSEATGECRGGPCGRPSAEGRDMPCPYLFAFFLKSALSVYF
jgi:hypothetical protein